MRPIVPLFLLAAVLATPAVAMPSEEGLQALNLGWHDDDGRFQIKKAPPPDAAPTPVPAETLVLDAAPIQQPPAVMPAQAVSPIPEPSTNALLLGGLGAVALVVRRRSKRK
jgi:hypothetical protein